MRGVNKHAVFSVACIGLGGWLLGYGTAREDMPWWWVVMAVWLLTAELWIHAADRNDALEWV